MVQEVVQHAIESVESELEPIKVSPIPVEPAMYYYSYPGSVKKNLFDNREPGDLSEDAHNQGNRVVEPLFKVDVERFFYSAEGLHGMNCDLPSLGL